MIKNNISKAQIEVWEWKESLYEELKNIPENKRLDYIHRKTKHTVDKLKRSIKKNYVDKELK